MTQLPSRPDGVAVAEGRLVAWIPGRLKNPLNGSQGVSRAGRIWRTTERREWRSRTMLVVRDAMNRSRWRYSPLHGAVVVLTAYVWNRFDEDGLAAALKPVVDGLVDATLIDGDGPSSGHRFERRQEINRRHRGVEVVVEPRFEEAPR